MSHSAQQCTVRRRSESQQRAAHESTRTMGPEAGRKIRRELLWLQYQYTEEINKISPIGPYCNIPGTSSGIARVYDCLWANSALPKVGRLDWRSHPSTQQVSNLPILFWRTKEFQSTESQSTTHQTTVATRFCKKPKCHGSYPWTYPCPGCPDRRRKSHPLTGRQMFQMSQKGTYEPRLSR